MLDLVKMIPGLGCAALVILSAACGGDDGDDDDTPLDADLRADLHIKQDLTVVRVDTAIEFTVVVENLGPGGATDAGLHMTLPAGIAVVSATCTAAGAAVCGGTSTANGAAWTGLDLPIATNDSNTVTLKVTAIPTRLGAGTLAAAIDVPAGVIDPDTSAASNEVSRDIDRTLAQLSSSGGRVDWFRGAGTSTGAGRPILYDRPPPAAPDTTEIYLAGPDSGMPACISCGADFARAGGYVGNPSWHPNGEYLVMQVENASSAHALYNTPGWGVDNDLWLLKVDGTWAARIWIADGVHHGALHPQFSPDGQLLVFGERIAVTPTANPAPGLAGQDPYRGWGLRVAHVDPSVLGLPAYNGIDAPFLTDSVRLAPNEAVVFPVEGSGNGRYEPTAISNLGAIDYSFTPVPGAGHTNNQYIDAGYTCTLDTTGVLATASCGAPTALAGADVDTWDDAPQRAGTRISFASSRADTTWAAQTMGDLDTTLRTELFVKASAAAADSTATALTAMNTTREPANRYVVGDHRWSTDGTRLVVEVTPVAVSTGLARTPEVWLIAAP